MFGQEGGCNKRFFFYQPVCVLQNVGGPFLGKFWLIFKNTIKQVFQHIFKAQKWQTNDHF